MTKPKQETILVVDDEVYLREIIAEDLERAGYAILQASCGTEALKVVEASPIDLVVSDVRMPSGTGIELLVWLRSRVPYQPRFIFMTAFADLSSNMALNLGAEAFLRKPVEKSELLDHVRSALTPREEKWSRTPSFEGSRCLDLGVVPFSDTDAPLYALGQGGVFVAMTTGFPTCFEVVEFRIDGDGGQQLSGFGRIRWIRHESSDSLPAGIGIEFETLPEASRKLVLEHLERARPRAYIPIGPDTAASP